MATSKPSDQDGLIKAVMDYFLTDEVRANTEDAFRARIIVVFAIAVSIWGPVYSIVLYALDRSSIAVATLMTATVLIGGSPFLMRRGVSNRVLGHWITFNTFLIVNAVALLGYGSESLWWQSIVVMVAVLLCSIRAGLVWLVISAGSLLAYFELTSAGIVAEGPFTGATEVYWDFSVMTGLYVVVTLLTVAYEWMKRWALAAIRSREAHTHAILRAAPDGIVTLDATGRMVAMNRAAEAIFGYDFDDDLEGASLGVIVPDLAGEVRAADLKARFEGWMDGRHEVEGVRNDGRRFPLEVSAGPIEHDDRWVVVVRDITGRKQVHRELERARDQAVRANQSKSAFLANMSHELRTPLNAVIGYSELIREELADQGHERVIPDLERINVAGEHLLSLINDVLDISKIEAGQMDLELAEFDLRPVIEDVASTARPLVEGNGNRFEVDVDEAPSRVEADCTKLRQMLFNLLSNAAKFTEDAMVRLRVFGEQRQGTECYVIEVEDRGIGISEDKLDELFETFTQADASTTREYGGTGLGLAITREFVEMQGGTITVDSTPGVGSTFRICLPVHQSCGNTAQQSEQQRTVSATG